MEDVNHSGVNPSIDIFDETEFCVRRYTNFMVFSSGYENVSRQTFYDYHNEVTTELMIKPREGYSEESKYAAGFSFTKSRLAPLWLSIYHTTQLVQYRRNKYSNRQKLPVFRVRFVLHSQLSFSTKLVSFRH